ncbi:mutS domain V domain-containing protein [Ditylenchus destructor]|uniref:MutS domain V domain-containing protein n=1 Tax=Ditylenchus destructor TaxID=166010 RepID=A0AAD4QZV5_9BILA|nr:mutS domain V domain-containing protein [Ditylenchus destructor]
MTELCSKNGQGNRTRTVTNLDITDFNTSKSGPKYKAANLSSRNSKNHTTSTSTNSFTIVALIEGRGNDRGQIGFASMDLRHSELSLCQFVDTNSYTLLKIRLSLCDPIEIVLPENTTEKNNPGEVLIDLLSSMCQNVNITTVQRRFFNDSRGIELVKQLGLQECSNVFADSSVFTKYSCMAAAAALIKYIEFIQNILFAQSSLKITYESVNDSCLIDLTSWKSLDLIHIDRRPQKGEYNSLFEILNTCVTPGGTKTMKSCLLQPCTDAGIINSRLDVVEELVRNAAMLERIKAVLSNLHDLQHLITMCVHLVKPDCFREDSTRTIRSKLAQTIELRNLLVTIKSLRGILQQAKSPFFRETRQDSRLNEIGELVNTKINSVAATRKRKSWSDNNDAILFAVNEGQHVLLDLARRAYQELQLQIHDIGNQEQQIFSNVELVYSQSRGYHLKVNATDPCTLKLPPQYIQVIMNKTSLSFTTRNLIKSNDRLRQSENEILIKSNLVLDQLIAGIRGYLPALYNVIECISLIDFFAALATYSAKVKGVRPTFGEQLLIRQGRHPILDYKKDVVPNDTLMLPDARFAIIAGPNMAGKSTYMKQVLLLQILAQCGAMIPATFASFIPMNRIFSRVGHNDDLCQNLSGFAVEMSEMSVILQNANEKSLIIIDELARSTSTEEGIGMCYALCEELISRKAFVLFATHYLDLSLMELNYPVIQNFHFTADTNVDDDGEEFLVPNHILYKGPYKGPLYGLELAQLTTLPKSIIESAQKMARQLRSDLEEQHASSQTREIMRRKKLGHLAFRILHLLKLKDETNKVGLIATYLKQLQIRSRNEEF